jgi:hypothetical protein
MVNYDNNVHVEQIVFLQDDHSPENQRSLHVETVSSGQSLLKLPLTPFVVISRVYVF